jgi:Na+-translocating ferredoxin:NAD+ oxidoreductase subunit G
MEENNKTGKGITGVVRMIASLAVVGAVAGATLVLVYSYAMPRIKKNVSEETQKEIRNIFPEAGSIDRTGEKDVYRVTGKGGLPAGYAFVAEGNGYQGVIKLIVGVDTAMKAMKGMAVLESQETPGLGAEIASSPFLDQFKGLSLTHAIEYVKNKKPGQPYEIEAITGATISSRAVVNILNKRIDELRKVLKVE